MSCKKHNERKCPWKSPRQRHQQRSPCAECLRAASPSPASRHTRQRGKPTNPETIAHGNIDGLCHQNPGAPSTSYRLAPSDQFWLHAQQILSAVTLLRPPQTECNRLSAYPERSCERARWTRGGRHTITKGLILPSLPCSQLLQFGQESFTLAKGRENGELHPSKRFL